MLAGIARRIIETCGHQFADRPDMIRNSECHSWRLANGFMHAAKIIMRDVQTNGSNMMIQLLAETIRQSRVKSSGFRTQIYAARTFGILEGEGGRHRLSDLGRAIVDPNRVREARVRAFLSVPLYKALFDNHRGGVIPPAAALERVIVGLGVAEKQKERARQVFERAADQAGFFEHGKNRLVMPGVASGIENPPSPPPKPENGGNDGDGGGGKLDLDPLLIELLKKIPATDAGWPAPQRIRWFRTFAMNVSQIYDDDNSPVEIEIKIVKVSQNK
jgi:hypothetical protein